MVGLSAAAVLVEVVVGNSVWLGVQAVAGKAWRGSGDYEAVLALGPIIFPWFGPIADLLGSGLITKI
jgi:hypothetical protein